MANHEDVVKATVAKGFNVPLNMVGNNMNIRDTLSADIGDVTQVTAVLEDIFNICIAYDDARQFTTIQDIVDYVGRKLWWYNH
ncbi:hypothetical protein BJX66DRAFT_337484 [Aspergillus keveii]|uniref:Acyl carrier protein n=1 Tax=Aspergillus keveii TaxID=714993 RepID=A0ABR4G785_9EURO